MKKGVQKLWADLAAAKKPAKLSKQGRGVKLSIVDDIESNLSFFEDAMSEASYIYDELMPALEEKAYDIQRDVDNVIVNSSAGSLEDAIRDVSEPLKKLEDNADALGISPSDIYDDYDRIKEMIEDSGYVLRNWEDLENEFPLVYRLTNLK
jgi:hypothetical protein